MENMAIEKAILGGGCFWCVESVFLQLKGVTAVMSGYCGGETERPTYEAVCSGTSGHAEVVELAFDSAVVSYREILEVFFATHDPTTLNRQGPDFGTEYRSIIFYYSGEQRRVAEELKAELNRSGHWQKPIVTEILPAPQFYPAEAYHQKFFKRNPSQPYCTYNILPKLEKLRKLFPEKIK